MDLMRLTSNDWMGLVFGKDIDSGLWKLSNH